LDFAEPDLPPEWLVDGYIEARTVNVLSADTGAGKTWVLHALAVAMAMGTSWLGRAVQRGKVLYIDEENPIRLIKARLRALGLSKDGFGSVAYSARQGVAVGDPGWSASLERTLAEFVRTSWCSTR
jgi:RecA-family ATPase